MLTSWVAEILVAWSMVGIPLGTFAEDEMSEIPGGKLPAHDFPQDQQAILTVHGRDEAGRSMPAEIPSAAENLSRVREQGQGGMEVLLELRVDPLTLRGKPVDLHFLGPAVGVSHGSLSVLEPLLGLFTDLGIWMGDILVFLGRVVEAYSPKP